MTHHTWDYSALMRERGFRVTPQRQLILDVICDCGGHCTPEEIYEQIHTRAPALNRATVYRTLDFLCELRLIVAADMGGGRKVYELAGAQPHHHLVCRTCGSVLRIEHDIVKALYDRVNHEQGFKIDMDHMALFGLCARCQRQEVRKMAALARQRHAA